MFIFTEEEADSPGLIRCMALLLNICSEESCREIRTLLGLVNTTEAMQRSDNDNEWAERHPGPGAGNVHNVAIILTMSLFKCFQVIKYFCDTPDSSALFLPSV